MARLSLSGPHRGISARVWRIAAWEPDLESLRAYLAKYISAILLFDLLELENRRQHAGHPFGTQILDDAPVSKVEPECSSECMPVFSEI
jgi:hypothetical protein